MNPSQAEISDKVTVLVFKDNFAARTFNIPLAWFSRLGLILGLIVTLAFSTSLLALKYYRTASRADVSRVQSLELELAELKTALRTAQTPAPYAKTFATGTPGKPPSSPTALTSGANNAVAVDTHEQTNSPTPKGPNETNLTETSPSKPLTPFIFSALLPTEPQVKIPDSASLPFVIKGTRFSWKGKTLTVYFALQYVKQDQGNQQGRIVVLARGPDTLLAYPSGVFTRAGSPNLIEPKEGEFFSVSRFREGNAEFGPLNAKSAIQEVEILILNKEGHLLRYEKYHLKSSEKQTGSTEEEEEK